MYVEQRPTAYTYNNFVGMNDGDLFRRRPSAARPRRRSLTRLDPIDSGEKIDPNREQRRPVPIDDLPLKQRFNQLNPIRPTTESLSSSFPLSESPSSPIIPTGSDDGNNGVEGRRRYSIDGRIRPNRYIVAPPNKRRLTTRHSDTDDYASINPRKNWTQLENGFRLDENHRRRPRAMSLSNGDLSIRKNHQWKVDDDSDYRTTAQLIEELRRGLR
jgi:hypothetical protein